MRKPKAKLDQWRLDFDMVTEKYFLVGKIYKDEQKRFANGQRIHTSEVFNIDFGNMTAETKNTIYTLKSMGFNL